MLSFVSCKVKKNEKNGYLYLAKWVSAENENKYAFFRFRISTDDYIEESDFNNLSGVSGQMYIETKSMLPFANEDKVYIQGQRYNIRRVDSNRRHDEDTENAFSIFKNNGNLVTTLLLRRAG